MPPEPLPPDSKDFVFPEQKQDRGPPQDGLGSDGGSSSGFASPAFSTNRRRDQYLLSSPRFTLSGHQEQNCPDDHGSCGFIPTRIEGEGFRGRLGVSSRKYSSGRDDRVYPRRSPLNPDDLPQRNHDFVASMAQRSVADSLTPASSSQLPSMKAHHDKNDGGVNDGPHTGLGDVKDRDHSLGPMAWIPLKWSRSGNFSSSTKPIISEPNGGNAETSVPPGKESPIGSLPMSPTFSDEGSAKKKPRLGWGQGLMKYEKQKEGLGVGSGKSVIVQGSSGAKLTTSDVSTRLTDPGASASPATPSSITHGSSQGFEEKLDYSAEKKDGTSHLNDSPACQPQRSPEFSMNLEHFNAVSLSYVNSLIADVLQSEDVCSGDSFSTREPVSDKLLLLKDDALKALEKTVLDIDFFENEVKNLDAELNRTCACPASHPEADMISRKECHISSCSPSNVSVSDHAPTDQPPHSSVSLDKFQAELKVDEADCAVLIKPKQNNLKLGEQDSANATYGRMYEDPGVQTTGSVDLKTKDSSVESDETSNGVAVHLMDGYHRNDTSFSFMESSLVAQITASNKDTAKKASEALGKWLPFTMSHFLREDQSISLDIKEKLIIRKRFLKFKERALSLKYRVFQLLWKEDQCLLSLSKQCMKSQKKFEINRPALQNVSFKHRTFGLQSSLPGNIILMPTKEIASLTGKMLSDSKIKTHRGYLKMPALILDEWERRHSRFITKNGLIEDPILFEKEKALINPWTAEEKRLFLEMLGTFGKDFKKIASFLQHKTTADCIEFYYKNHKSKGFETVKKRLKARKQQQSLSSNSGVVPSGDKLKHEFDSASLDLLGEVSASIAHSNDTRIRQKHAGRSLARSPYDTKVSFDSCTRVSGDDHAKTTAADVLAGIVNSISSEGMCSCITTSANFEKLEYLQVDRPLYPVATQTIDEEHTCSDEDFGEREFVDWTDAEKAAFIRALGHYGRDFSRISRCLGSRTKEQCKIFFSKARKCLALDMILEGSGNDGEVPSNNEGKSETGDACVAEMESAICSNQSCSKVDDFLDSGRNGSRHESQQPSDFRHQTDMGYYEWGDPNPQEVQTTMAKPASDYFDDDRKPATRDEANQSEMRLEEKSESSLRNDDSEKPYGAVDNGIKKHINALISPVLSVAKEEFVKVGPDSVEDRSHVVVNFHDDNSSKCKFEPCFPHSGVNCKLEFPHYTESFVGCDGNRKSKTCNGAAFEPFFDSKGNTYAQENITYFQGIIFTPNHRNQVSPRFLSHSHKNQVLSWRQECASMSAKTTLSETSFTQLDDHIEAAKQSAGVLEDHDKNHQYHDDRDIHQHYLLGNEDSVQTNQSLQIIERCPMRMLNRNKMDEDRVKLDGKMFSLSLGKKSVHLDHALALLPSSHSDKGGSHSLDDVDISGPLVPKDSDSSDAQLRPCSQITVSETKGQQSLPAVDFKLFGKILSHPPVIQKSQVDEKSPSKPGYLSLKLPNGRTDKTFVPLQTETRSTAGIEELPLKSYGFWDGTRIQMGFPSLLDPSILLSKYPGAPPCTMYRSSKENVGGNRLPIHQHSFSVDGEQKDVICEPKKIERSWYTI